MARALLVSALGLPPAQGLGMSPVKAPMLAFGAPPDVVAWVAFALGLGLLVVKPSWARGALASLSKAPRLPLTLLSVTAFALSLGYFFTYLGGAPRIIDAASYLLEARSFAAGSFSFPVSEPSALFRGRFLLPIEGETLRVGVIFPPGYPTALSAAVLLGDYRLLGPGIGALLCAVTYLLGKATTGRTSVGLLAAAFSMLSATLRYHSADTMSHGWSTLLTTLSLLATVTILKARGFTPAHFFSFEAPTQLAHVSPKKLTFLWTCLGLCLGLLIATRQLTGLAVSLACLLPLLQFKRSPASKSPLALAAIGRLSALGLAALPGLVLLGLHHRALTGTVLTSPQLAYYKLADGPPGCFGLGLGRGCFYEHFDAVSAQGGEGLTATWAAINTVHRLHWHSLDVANFELLLIPALFFLFKERRHPVVRPLLLLTLLLPIAYASFYFAGSYPGGGARFFLEQVPALQVALAATLVHFGSPHIGLALSLLGFAVHGVFSHHSLPGAPPPPELLDPSATPRPSDPTHRPAQSTSATPRLVESDLAFNRLFDPATSLASPTVIRNTHDDRVGFFLGGALATAQARILLESEADYPPRLVEGLWVHPAHVSAPCVSGGRALALESPSPGARLGIEVTAARPGSYRVLATTWSPADGCTSLDLGVFWLPRLHVLPVSVLKGASHLDRLELISADPPTSQPPSKPKNR